MWDRVSAAEHRQIVEDFCDFMAGRTDTMIRRLEREMEQAESLEFERAARLRDDMAALRKAMEKQAVVFDEATDADVVAFAEDPLQAAVQVFHVRGGGYGANEAGSWKSRGPGAGCVGAPFLYSGLRGGRRSASGIARTRIAGRCRRLALSGFRGREGLGCS